MFKKLVLNTIKKALDEGLRQINAEQLMQTILEAIDNALESIGIDIIETQKEKEDAKKK